MEKPVKNKQRTVRQTNCRFCSFRLKVTGNVDDDDERLNDHILNHFRPLIAIKGAPVLPIKRNFEEFEIWKRHIGSKTNASEMITKLQKYALRIDQKQGGF